jgi:hypothetical protein
MDMGCCGNHNHGDHQQESNHNHGNSDGHNNGGGKLHKILMMLCCIIPIALVAVLFLIKPNIGGTQTVLPVVLLLLCPLSHLILMPLMNKLHRH